MKTGIAQYRPHSIAKLANHLAGKLAAPLTIGCGGGFMADNRKVRQMVSELLGKKLSTQNVIHHIDGNPKNNNNWNLVVCENQAYHNFIHLRKRAIEACGNKSYRQCEICHKWDDPQNLFIRKYNATTRNGNTGFHPKCHSQEVCEYYAKYPERKWRSKVA